MQYAFINKTYLSLTQSLASLLNVWDKYHFVYSLLSTPDVQLSFLFWCHSRSCIQGALSNPGLFLCCIHPNALRPCFHFQLGLYHKLSQSVIDSTMSCFMHIIRPQFSSEICKTVCCWNDVTVANDASTATMNYMPCIEDWRPTINMLNRLILKYLSQLFKPVFPIQFGTFVANTNEPGVASVRRCFSANHSISNWSAAAGFKGRQESKIRVRWK